MQFIAIMDNYGLKKRHIKRLKTNKDFIYVIAPQRYNKVEKLTKQSDAMKYNYFDRDDRWYASDSTLTTGTGADPWYKASKGMLKALSKFAKKVSKIFIKRHVQMVKRQKKSKRIPIRAKICAKRVRARLFVKSIVSGNLPRIQLTLVKIEKNR